MIGPISLFGKGIFLLVRLLSKYWWVAFTLILIMSGLVVSIQEAKEQEDARIVFRFLGTSLAVADEGIYEIVQDLEFESPKKEGIVGQLSYYAEFGWFLLKNLWIPLWMIFFWFMLFFKGERFLMGNDSKSRNAFILAIATMILLQLLVSGTIFRGLIALTKFVVGVITSV